MNYTEKYIESLITCQKIIIEFPGREMKIEKKHKRNDMKLKSLNTNELFYVFMRMHLDFRENFSIGLIHQSLEGQKNVLLRLNGNHGQVVTDPIRPSPHFGFHIHKITANDWGNDIFEPKSIELTKEYASFNEALKYFIKMVNITNAPPYFPHIYQKKLFEI